MIKDFSELKVWQISHNLTIKIYKETSKFPENEKYGIISQIRRSASSISANIAEGFSRNSTKEFIQFLYKARGSLSETVYFLILSKDLKLIDKNLFNEISNNYKILLKKLNSLIKSLKQKI